MREILIALGIITVCTAIVITAVSISSNASAVAAATSGAFKIANTLLILS